MNFMPTSKNINERRVKAKSETIFLRISPSVELSGGLRTLLERKGQVKEIFSQLKGGLSLLNYLSHFDRVELFC